VTHEALPWLVFPPAVDLANTVIATPAGNRDLLGTEDDLDAWVAAERGRIPGVDAAGGRLADVRQLRDIVRAVLHARAGGKRPPEAARRRINAMSSAAPIRITLTAGGRAKQEPEARDAYSLFEASIARSAIELAGEGGDRLLVCGAPSCGMLFLREHPRQVWCSKACGNRARVARHEARRRSQRRTYAA
jgi:predicted RNA-binding Zn ribbon-like protein